MFLGFILSICSKYDREYDFDIILGQVVLCCKLRWICRKHSNDAARQVETPITMTIYLVSRHNFIVASLVTHYHDSKQVNAAIDMFSVWLPVNYCDILHRVVLHSSGILYNTYSMKTNVLLHFEHENDVISIIKQHRATRLWLVALYKSLIMIVTSFLCYISSFHPIFWLRSNVSVNSKPDHPPGRPPGNVFDGRIPTTGEKGVQNPHP